MAGAGGVDHFIPGLAVDKSTSGSTGHLVLAFYYYPVSNCSSSTCQLDLGYSSSTNGGSSWTSTTNITGPMTLSWLANTTQGRMVGDYISSSFNGSGVAFPVFAADTQYYRLLVREAIATNSCNSLFGCI